MTRPRHFVAAVAVSLAVFTSAGCTSSSTTPGAPLTGERATPDVVPTPSQQEHPLSSDPTEWRSLSNAGPLVLPNGMRLLDEPYTAHGEGQLTVDAYAYSAGPASVEDLVKWLVARNSGWEWKSNRDTLLVGSGDGTESVRVSFTVADDSGLLVAVHHQQSEFS